MAKYHFEVVYYVLNEMKNITDMCVDYRHIAKFDLDYDDVPKDIRDSMNIKADRLIPNDERFWNFVGEQVSKMFDCGPVKIGYNSHYFIDYDD